MTNKEKLVRIIADSMVRAMDLDNEDCVALYLGAIESALKLSDTVRLAKLRDVGILQLPPAVQAAARILIDEELRQRAN